MKKQIVYIAFRYKGKMSLFADVYSSLEALSKREDSPPIDLLRKKFKETGKESWIYHGLIILEKQLHE